MKHNISKLLSNIPLVPITYNGHIIYLLLEKYNLLWNVKMIPVYWMLHRAIEKGILDQNKIVLEASSGNTAISLAYWSKILDLKVLIVLPSSTATCKKKIIKSYGVDIVEVAWNTEDAIKKRDEIFSSNPWKYWIPDQFSNWDNFESHYLFTAQNILDFLDGQKLDFFVAGLGTSGTLLGAGKKLKEIYSNIEIVAVNPEDRIEWLRNFRKTALSIPFYEKYKNLITHFIDIKFDQAIQGVKYLLEYGYFVWISSGANFYGTMKYLNSAETKDKKVGVVVCPDGGDMYLDSYACHISSEMFKKCR